MAYYEPGLGKTEPFSRGLLMALLGCLTPACVSFGILTFLAPLFGPGVDYREVALVLFAPATVVALMALGQAFWRSLPLIRGEAQTGSGPTILWGDPVLDPGKAGQVAPEADLMQRVS